MTDAELLTAYDDAAFGLLDGHLLGLRAVERAARAAEREACARICDMIEECEDYAGSTPGAQASARCADTIRNRAERQR